MKKDNNSRTAVSKPAASRAAVSDPMTVQQQERRMEAASPPQMWSNRYIDSRLKQFSCR